MVNSRRRLSGRQQRECCREIVLEGVTERQKFVGRSEKRRRKLGSLYIDKNRRGEYFNSFGR